jgi:hypothetical protein
MRVQFVIDCGSRSIKLHEAQAGAVTLQATRSWDPINDAANVERVGELLKDLTRGVPAISAIHVVGTAAARRDPRVAAAIDDACRSLGWTYQTLSHAAEARLIRDAFAVEHDCDVVNAGGGSIQIVRPDGHADLLVFGISDLNQRFKLSGPVEDRRIAEAYDFVRAALPLMRRPFIYSGGELSYLVAFGANVDRNGRCEADEFFRLAAEVDAMEIDEMEFRSPFDPAWVRGAVASNAIVKAMLIESRADHYYASDVNIADGIIAGIAAGRVAHAPDARL